MNLQSILHNIFALLLTSSIVCSAALLSGHASAPIAESAERVQPPGIGDQAPRFVVSTPAGDDVVFDPERLKRPAVLLTFRGGWCPYCNVYLSEMRHVIPEIAAMGVDVLFLSGDRPDQLYESLSREAQEDIAGLDSSFNA